MSIRMGDKILAANYKPSNASEETAGIIKIATDMEITEGLSKNTAVTPYQLANAATKTQVDEVTITKDSEDLITTIGMKTKTDTYLYDWVGTLEEYNLAKESDLIEPNWICWITNDEGDYTPQYGSGVALLDPIYSGKILEGNEKVGKEEQGSLVTSLVYPDAYNTLLSYYNAGEDITSVVSGLTVNYRKCTNGWKIMDIGNKDVYDNLYSINGTADYFVIDSTNKQFYLPKVKKLPGAVKKLYYKLANTLVADSTLNLAGQLTELKNTKQNKLTAGGGISINKSNNVISINLTYDEENYRMIFGG